MAEETTKQVIEDDPIEVRKAKRAALIEAGENPYGHAFHYTHHLTDLDEKYASLEDGASTEDEVDVAGRIMAKRVQGKIAFFELRDATGDIQLFCRINALGEEVFAAMKDLDVGDWIGVHGTMMRTKRGQLSVAVTGYELLSKSLRPLPEKFHGLADKETRYRQRYVDLVMNPEVKSTFEKRFKIVAAIRRYMEQQGFYEVETPFLHPILGGANAKPFVTHFNALDRDYFLRIATELPLKRLLVGGFEKVFEIGRQFRNEGMDPYHNPEFTTMEAYRAFSDLEGMKALAQGVIKAANKAIGNPEVIEYQGQTIDLSGEWASRPMTDIVSDVLGKQVTIDTPVEELAAAAREKGLEIKPEWTAGKIIAEIYDELGEDTIVNPTFVCDYPIEVSPLAKRFEDDPRLTHRFELVIAGSEKKGTVITEEEKRIIAYHEVGHALVAAKQKNAQPVSKITIVPHTQGALGYTLHLPEEEKFLMSREDILAEIRTLLAGRSSEEIVCNTMTSGAANDIERATELARNLVARFGMCDEFDMMALGTIQSQYLDGSYSMTCAQETYAAADRETIKIIRQCHQEAKRILQDNRELLDKIAAYLLKKETITGQEMMAIIEGRDPETVDNYGATREQERKLFRPSVPETIEAPAKHINMVSEPVPMPDFDAPEEEPAKASEPPAPEEAPGEGKPEGEGE